MCTDAFRLNRTKGLINNLEAYSQANRKAKNDEKQKDDKDNSILKKIKEN